jgi:hypothetical protein
MVTRFDKAIVAGLGAAGAVLATAQVPGNSHEEVIGIIALAAGVIVGVVTFLVPNKAA